MGLGEDRRPVPSNECICLCEVFTAGSRFMCCTNGHCRLCAAMDGDDISATDLARAWEGVPELRRRAQLLQLVARLGAPLLQNRGAH